MTFFIDGRDEAIHKSLIYMSCDRRDAVLLVEIWFTARNSYLVKIARNGEINFRTEGKFVSKLGQRIWRCAPYMYLFRYTLYMHQKKRKKEKRRTWRIELDDRFEMKINGCEH